MLAERLNEAVRRTYAVGAVAATIHKGAREFAAAGVADAGTGAVMTEATPLRIASITKPIVTTAVYLALRGEPGALDAPLVEHLPELRSVWRLPPEVTLRRVLSHTAGLRDTDAATLRAYGDGDDALMMSIAKECTYTPAWRPGTAWRYCNAGFRFAGAVLARKHGGTFEDALRDLVLAPAGMTATGFATPDGAACGHAKGRPQPTGYVRARRPGGGLWSTAADVLSFAEFGLADQTYLDDVRRVQARSAFGHRYGLGWFLGPHSDGPHSDVIFHFGDVAGFRCLLAIAPDQATASFVLGNDEHGGVISRDVAFGEITRLTGRPRPHRGPARLAAEYARLGLAKLR
jgi:D-alanyl-D-alanine carboxypeptidase